MLCTAIASIMKLSWIWTHINHKAWEGEGHLRKIESEIKSCRCKTTPTLEEYEGQGHMIPVLKILKFKHKKKKQDEPILCNVVFLGIFECSLSCDHAYKDVGKMAIILMTL